jgi:hypothetical protein
VGHPRELLFSWEGISMLHREFGEVLAQRELTIEGSPEERIIVIMGVPRRDSEAPHDFICPIRITGPATETIKYARGIDAFQALKLGMDMLGMQLYAHLNQQLDGRLRWNGGSDLGFPLPAVV